ncbi:ATP-binding protein [Terasakiella pusilla]|uniref:ATP-binding protein n=1 Tax=Terasakiella pusilla TaxID=64973 RepID=UPI00048D374F|nr:ATP-binding protein [Terasakiella pusilla]
MSVDEIDLEESWKKSRHGAWAGRGFHYQHLVIVVLLLRQWAGKAECGFVIPEGLEDCVVEYSEKEVWIQVKSRKEGEFRAQEIKGIHQGMREKSSSLNMAKQFVHLIVAEKSCSDCSEQSFDNLHEAPADSLIVCSSPVKEALEIIISTLNIDDVIADKIISDIYRYVAEISERNASLSYDLRGRISVSDIENRIVNLLEASDPSVIEEALKRHFIKPIDFKTPLQEPSFYLGVKAQPGHIAQNLIVERPEEYQIVERTLKQKRFLLISGPSGSGKSAFLWSACAKLTREIRWFSININLDVDAVQSVVSFIKSKIAVTSAPIGIAFDEIGSVNKDAFNALYEEISCIPKVYLLGSIREEDKFLIRNSADISFESIALSETLAKSIWEKLKVEGSSPWEHWREPFENSDGLMLEYVHLLTKGERLQKVINQQILQREKEDREDELSIIRSCSVICSQGAEVDIDKLLVQIGLSKQQGRKALQRLIDEHLIFENRPGVLGGAHQLRSLALRNASHDELIYRWRDTYWSSIGAATKETIPFIVRSAFEVPPEDLEYTYTAVGKILEDAESAEGFSAILTGVGQAAISYCVDLFIECLVGHEVPRSLWSFASMFVDPKTNIPEMDQFVEWGNLRQAVLAYRMKDKVDFRLECLNKIERDTAIPQCSNLGETLHLMSCCVPIVGLNGINVTMAPDIELKNDFEIYEVADLLSVAETISLDCAKALHQAFGGNDNLFRWFYEQTPWVTYPEITENDEGKIIARADYHFIFQEEQDDVHAKIVEICETLKAISPTSDVLASEVITPLGHKIDDSLGLSWSKEIPRENLHPKTIVAWNVAFRQMLLAKVSEESLTSYVLVMSDLLVKTEQVFGKYTEKWIRGKPISGTDQIASEINYVLEEVKKHAYASQVQVAEKMLSPGEKRWSDESFSSLISGILGNLLPRLLKAGNGENTKGTAVFASDLVAQSERYRNSEIWRVVDKKPEETLIAISKRLKAVSNILHEMDFDRIACTNAVIRAAKKGGTRKRIFAAERWCLQNSEKRYFSKIKEIKSGLEREGKSVDFYYKEIDQQDSWVWPSKEVAIVFEINDLEKEMYFLDEIYEVAQSVFNGDFPYCFVLSLKGFLLDNFALHPVNNRPFPVENFKGRWGDVIGLPCLSVPIIPLIDKALNACGTLSGIISCRDLDELNVLEETLFDRALETFESAHSKIVKTAEKTNHENELLAADFVAECWEAVRNEFELSKAGAKSSKPFYNDFLQNLLGKEAELPLKAAHLRIILYQAECERLRTDLGLR